MDPALWALAFTLLPWPERQKAALWASLQAGLEPGLAPEGRRDLERLARELPRHRAEAAVRGTLPPAGPALAMVGSREAARPALERARHWGRTLTAAGVAVLSGLARGIDGAAHRGALEAGATWGILGSGLDHPYPPEHAGLMDRIVAAGGGVLTPFPLAARPLKWHFPRRNLILAAWTQGVVLVAARYASGSLVTAKLALDLGKELWACPGAPEDLLAEGPNRLLREGAAKVCLSAQDIVEDIRFLRWGLTNAP